jgi:3-dehydroquinate synthase
VSPRLFLAHAAGRTRVEIVPDLFAEPGVLLDAIPPASRVFLLTDSNVAPLWAEPVERLLAEGKREARRIVLPAGEKAKTLSTVSEALDSLLDGGIRRDDRVVALGGGVLGDEAGLAASLALRGIPLVQVPTTLLAMVDSSVGGKTGVDHPTGKNRIGTFFQPVAVIVSPLFLRTLPEREIRAGLVEAAKGAWLAGEEETKLFEALPPSGVAADPRLLPVVEASIRFKLSVVEEDEREGGRRRILNLGHTIGHALEASTGWGRFLHGEAVAWGLRTALEISVRRRILDSATSRRLAGLLDRSAPLPPVADLPFERIEPFLAADKKVSAAGGSVWILLEGIGRPRVAADLSRDEIRSAWDGVRSGGSGQV